MPIFWEDSHRGINDSSDEWRKYGLAQGASDFFLHLKAADMASGTISCYKRSLEWLKEILENRSLQDISGKEIEKAVIKLRNSSKRVSHRSVATMNKIKTSFRSFFKWAFQSGLISNNPTVSLRLAKAASQRTIPMAVEEINAILQVISNCDSPYAERDKALFATYAFTGIRCAEALALRIKDYDRSTLLLYLPVAKGTTGRVQPVPRRLSFILEKYIDILHRNGQADPNAFLFQGRCPKKPLTTRQIRFRFKRWKAISGIQGEPDSPFIKGRFCYTIIPDNERPSSRSACRGAPRA
jgi:site-specific recombinase XerD